jgi:hypothetical protein
MSEPAALPVDAPAWVHPTGRTPESVLVMALGPSKHSLLELTTSHEPPPAVMNCDEWWGINGGANAMGGRVAYDLLWVMDYLDGEERKEPAYAAHLKRWLARHPQAALMTSQAGSWGLLPQVHEYPLGPILDRYPEATGYFANSVPYILAYALFVGVKRLVLWGADYNHESLKRREDDRANAEYWVGYCRAKGMHIQVPADTTLLNTNRGPELYGYRDPPLHLLREVS